MKMRNLAAVEALCNTVVRYTTSSQACQSTWCNLREKLGVICWKMS